MVGRLENPYLQTTRTEKRELIFHVGGEHKTKKKSILHIGGENLT